MFLKNWYVVLDVLIKKAILTKPPGTNSPQDLLVLYLRYFQITCPLVPSTLCPVVKDKHSTNYITPLWPKLEK
jgi:hypothetical protein